MSNRFNWAGESPSGYFEARKGKGRRTAILFAAAVSAILGGRARADTYYLQHSGNADWDSTGDGYFSWFDSSTNNPSIFVPPTGSTVFVLQSGTYGVSNTIVNYNYAYSSPGLNELEIESGNQVNQSSSNSAMYVSGDTYIGYDLGSSGQYIQSAGTASFNTLYLGYNGSGTYSLSGGSVSIGAGLVLGSGTGSSGMVNLSNGFMNVSSDEYVGNSGMGQFIQSGGINYIGSGNSLVLGYAPGGGGTYTLSGQGSLVADQVIVGFYGSGIYNQSSGVATIGSSWMFVGAEQGSSGTANISGGLLTIDGYLEDGYYGNGTFNHTGGTVHASYLLLGEYTNGTSPASVGIYNLSNTANLIVDNDVRVGDSGVGCFNQYGGSASIGGFLLVGFEAGSSGSVNLSGGFLNVSTEEDVGYNGNGQFYQSGGTNMIPTDSVLVLGDNVGSSGTYTLAGGLLTGPATTFVGNSGLGNFVQTGGTHVSTTVIMGYTNGAFGTYALSGQGSLIASQTVVGWYGSGIFNQSGGSASIQQFYLGYAVGGNGTANISNGLLHVTGFINDGYSGNGAINQTGGTVNASSAIIGSFTNGTSPASVGIYNLSNSASLIIDNNISVGGSGVGYLNQYGGTFAMNGAGTNGLRVGDSGGSTGVVNLSGGLMNAVGAEYVGYSGNGFFNQTGGSNTTASLYIAYSNSASGTYSLSGGVLTSSSSTANNGQFTQSGGTASLGAVTGSGAMTLGGATELTTVTKIQQSAVTINAGGYLGVASNMVQFTNSISTLTLNGSGQMDLGNNTLYTTTSSNTIRQYLINGYNGGAWNGTGGISSVNANASYNVPASNGGHFTALGYSSGTTIAALGLTAGQTLVKYTIYGDANLDGTVDINDLNIVLSNFLSGNPATWDTGDFYYAGETDISDLNAVLSNFFDSAPTTVRAAKAAAKASASTASTAKTLTGTVSPADTVNPPPANGVLELVVNIYTGDVELEGNNADIASLQITSASGSIITANWTDLHANGYTNWSDTAKKKTGIGEYDNQFTASGDYAVLGVVDYGDIYNTSINAFDYVFKYGSVESNDTTVDTDTGSVIYYIPEPTTLSLLGLAAAGLMARRRRRR